MLHAGFVSAVGRCTFSYFYSLKAERLSVSAASGARKERFISQVLLAPASPWESIVLCLSFNNRINVRARPSGRCGGLMSRKSGWRAGGED